MEKILVSKVEIAQVEVEALPLELEGEVAQLVEVEAAQQVEAEVTHQCGAEDRDNADAKDLYIKRLHTKWCVPTKHYSTRLNIREVQHIPSPVWTDE